MQQHPSRMRFVGAMAAWTISAGTAFASAGPSRRMISLATGIAYVPGDIERSLTCNTGVITTDGHLTIVDAAIPDGAAAAYAAIRARTDLPLSRVIDTHYHLDHTYGNAYWSDHGAQPLAYRGLRTELAKAEPELFGGGTGLWQTMAAKLPQLQTSRPMAPSYVANGTTFGAGSDEIRIVHPGVGHTHSDAVVWVPAARALFTGDLVVNGPYNAVADSTIGSWIQVLADLRALQPRIVVPGHGPAGGPELIDAQQRYFVTVTHAVDAAVASGRDVNAEIPAIRRRVLADPAIASFANDHHFPYSGFFHFHDLVATIYRERTGKTLARRSGPPPARCCGDIHRNRIAAHHSPFGETV